tara:strand:+ start:50576 stop:52348 length:1773 start_codon:yes stop_codon:yes gene_type:complete
MIQGRPAYCKSIVVAVLTAWALSAPPPELLARNAGETRAASESASTVPASTVDEGTGHGTDKVKGKDSRPSQMRTRPKAPFRTIYSNDTTHILSCKMPWRDRGDELTDAHLAKSITEAAGVDAHFLQPGLGWIPWWRSEIYSPHDHYDEFLQQEFGHRKINKIGRYLLAGGDMLDVLVSTCAEMQIAPFLSFRLNDGHHVRELREAIATGRPSAGMSRHYWQNYQRYRIGPDVANWDEGVLDWSIPEVREHKFRLIEEACQNYDLAGIELDFLRHWVRFGESTPIDQRRQITTDFVKRVRKMLDETAKERSLPYRYLCIRVPAKSVVRPEQGIDLKKLAFAGVDMVNLSYSYFTWQDDSVRTAVREIDDSRVAVYAEMTHTTMTGKATAGSGTQPFLRTTNEQFYSTANLAYRQGAHGVSLFNFPYYRYHVTDSIGPFHEPPFHVLSKLSDREFVASSPQWFFLTSGRNDRVLGPRELPAIVKREEAKTFLIQIAKPDQSRVDGILRVRSDEDISDRDIEVRFNGNRLRQIPHVEKPLDHPYQETWLGSPSEHACYALPISFIAEGRNKVSIEIKQGIRVRVTYIDVTMP